MNRWQRVAVLSLAARVGSRYRLTSRWSPGSVVGETAVRAVDQLVSVEIVFRNIDADRTVVLLVIRVVPTGIRAGHQEKTSAIQLQLANPRPEKKVRSHILAIGQSGSPASPGPLMRQVALMTTFTHGTTLDTVMGDIKLGKNGEWTHPRVLQGQFQGIVGQEGRAVRVWIKTGRRLTSLVCLVGVDISLCREQPGPTWAEE
jgi:hypothetical protein